MFSKISRYRKLPDEVTIGANGLAFQSKSLRLTPEVGGTFLHTVEDLDRLDHLGYKYYKQPRSWWHICDANPQFLSPQHLLGKEPIATGEFPIEFTGIGEPPYAPLLAALRRMAGVENALLADGDAGVLVEFNTMTVTQGVISSAIVAAGFSVGEMRNIGRVGKKIIIPPEGLA